MTAPPYVPKTTVPLLTAAARIAALNTLAEASQVEYDTQLFAADGSDLTPMLTRRGGAALGAVSRECTAEVAGKLQVVLSSPLQWGSVQVQPVMLARTREAPLTDNGWWAFPLGLFVLTSPGMDDMDAPGAYPATGYDVAYLLQSSPTTSFSFAAGSTYAIALRTIFRAAGVLGSTAALSAVCDYPAAWGAKTFAAASSFPFGANQSYLQIVNQLLGASGCRQLYADPWDGRFTIDLIPKASAQPLAWTWVGSTGTGLDALANYPRRKVMRRALTQYRGDVYNAVNRWVFVQSNLTFKPIEGSGQYTVNNVTDGITSQSAVGRVVTSVQTLDATGQADLKTQGDAIVADARSQYETINFTSAAWPAAGHFDVFRLAHTSFPLAATRRVQVQSWNLPLDGSGMSWQANVVSST